MKHLRSILLLCIACLPFYGINAQTSPTVSAADGNYLGYSYVDLGLPSGTLWATCNIGASSPEEAGDYFAWGETSPKRSFTWGNYKYGDGKKFTKYNIFEDGGPLDNLTLLKSEDDAATANWGGSWRVPIRKEVEELITKCSWNRQTVNGKEGYLGIGPNGNSVFFPDSGVYDDDRFEPGGGFYWMADLVTFALPDNALDMMMGKTDKTPKKAFSFGPMSIVMYTTSMRKEGQVIRPVVSQEDLPVTLKQVLDTDIMTFRTIEKLMKNKWIGLVSAYAFARLCVGDRSHSNGERIVDYVNNQLIEDVPGVGYYLLSLNGETQGPFKTEGQARRVAKANKTNVRELEELLAKNLREFRFREEFDAILTRRNQALAARTKRQPIISSPLGQEYRIVAEEKAGLISERGVFLMGMVENLPTKEEDLQSRFEQLVFGEERTDSLTMRRSFVKHVFEINKALWENKDEFETVEQYHKRMSYPYYGMAMGYFVQEALIEFCNLYNYPYFQLGPYDLDHETVMLKTDYGNIPILLKEAEYLELRSGVRDNRVFADELNFYYKFNSFQLKGARLIRFGNITPEDGDYDGGVVNLGCPKDVKRGLVGCWKEGYYAHPWHAPYYRVNDKTYNCSVYFGDQALPYQIIN